MRSLLLWIIAIPILTSTSWADDFDQHVADVSLLQSKPIQKELGITEAQRAAMNKHAEAHRSKLSAYEAQLKAKAQKDKKPIQPDTKVLASYFASLKAGVLKEMKPPQVKRLRELTLQRAGLQGVLDGKVAKRIGVNDATLKKLRDLYVSGAQQAAKIEQASFAKVVGPYKDRKPKNEAEAKKLQEEVEEKLAAERKSIQPQLEKIQNDVRTKMMALLNDGQKRAYVALQGKPFNWNLS
jgi:Skp family chaperone for outer membrane proteins